MGFAFPVAPRSSRGKRIDLEKATLELQKLKEDIKDTVNRLQTTEGLILSKEKEAAMTRFQRLLLIAGAATAERFAALEPGDIEETNLYLQRLRQLMKQKNINLYTFLKRKAFQ
ncbi:hypothetical protein Peur_014584 [Populus x canadensis]